MRRIKGILGTQTNFKWIKGFAKQNKTKKARNVTLFGCALRTEKLSYNEMYFYVCDMCCVHITHIYTRAHTHTQLTFDFIKTAGMWLILFVPI